MVTIDQATEADIETIPTLLGGIDAYYGSDGTPGDIDQIRATLFPQRPAATVLSARDEGAVVGMASYSFLWPAAGTDTSLYLKELARAQDYHSRTYCGQRAGCGAQPWQEFSMRERAG